MTFHRQGPVLVGADGSACSLLAVDFAARAAARHGRDLRITHASIWPLMRVPLGPAEGAPEGAGLRGQAEGWLRDAEAVAVAAAPGVTVTTELVTGAAGAVLLEAARSAGLLVVGSRGLGGFGALLLGSVGAQAATYAECPVIIVREPPTPGGPVVVGVDGSAASEAAVGFAFAEASARGVGLVAVHAADGEVGDYARHLLAESLGGFTARYADVPVETRYVPGKPSHAMIDASHAACLLVVGSRGRGGFKGLLLGSVSQAAIQHGSCPVAVVRADDA